MPFTTWTAELVRWKDALAQKDIRSFWIMTTENSREMRTTFTRLANISEFTEWLEMKAANESLSEEEGGSINPILFSIGGS